MFWAHTRSGASPLAAIAAPSAVNGTQIPTSTPPSGSRGSSSPTYSCVSEIVLNIFQLPAMYRRRPPSGVIQCLPPGQVLALQKLQGRPTARREPVDLVGQSELIERGARVAAA